MSFTPNSLVVEVYNSYSTILSLIPNFLFITQAKIKKTCHELCSLEISLDHLKETDFAPLLDLCMDLDASEIEAVDIHNESLYALDGNYALLLMHAINQKLRVVDLHDLSFGKDFLRYIVVFCCNLLCVDCFILLHNISCITLTPIAIVE